MKYLQQLLQKATTVPIIKLRFSAVSWFASLFQIKLLERKDKNCELVENIKLTMFFIQGWKNEKVVEEFHDGRIIVINHDDNAVHLKKVQKMITKSIKIDFVQSFFRYRSILNVYKIKKLAKSVSRSYLLCDILNDLLIIKKSNK